MVKFYDFETSMAIIHSMDISLEKKEVLINKLKSMPDITPEIIRDYEAKKCKPYNVEVDLFDNEFGYMTVAIDVFCESEEIANGKAELIIRQNKVYKSMEIKGVYLAR